MTRYMGLPMMRRLVPLALGVVVYLLTPHLHLQGQSQTPGAPTISSLLVGDTAVTVAWTAPDGAGADSITSYDLRHIVSSAPDKSDSRWDVVEGIWGTGGGDLIYVLHGLLNGTGHDIQIRAVTSNGAGFWSATGTASPTDFGNTRQTSRVMSPGSVIGGRLNSRSDTDVIRVNLTTSTDLVAYTTGYLDTIGRLLNSTGDELVSNDDGELSHGRLNFLVGESLQAGTYYISVRAVFGSVGDYTLHIVTTDDTHSTADAQVVEVGDWTVGVITSDTDVDFFQVDLAEQTDLIIRSAGLPYDTLGEVLDSDQTSVASGDLGYLPPNWSQFLIQTRLAAGTHYIKVTSVPGDPGPYALYVEEVTEPGDSIGEAAPLPVGKAVGGQINPSTDSDYFRIDFERTSLGLIMAVSESVEIEGQLLDNQGNSLNHVIRKEALPGGSFGFVLKNLRRGDYYLKVTGSGDTDTGSYAILALDYSYENRTYNWFRTSCKEIATDFDDPLYGCQWNLNNTGQLDGTEGEDANVEEVWDDYQGTGVNVAVVDDGLYSDHEDLTANIDRSRNHDYTEDTGGALAFFYNSHGTRVAGVIAAEANGLGVRGVAPGATIYGYNYLTHPTVANRFDAMTRGMSTTAVSNNSWGLGLDGPGLDHVDRFWELGVEQGVTRGYGGKGVFYSWAAGNGGSIDNSNLDELANYYGVTAVCAVNDLGVRAAYSEEGANLWVCAPSSDNTRDRPGITTTTIRDLYTESFGGTSSAAPVVSGVAALLREANPDLTWRDLKLILAASARKNDSSNTGWETGATQYGSDTATYSFNHEYGFGVVDAVEAVGLLDDWDLVPQMIRTARFRLLRVQRSPIWGVPAAPSRLVRRWSSSSSSKSTQLWTLHLFEAWRSTWSPRPMLSPNWRSRSPPPSSADTRPMARCDWLAVSALGRPGIWARTRPESGL